MKLRTIALKTKNISGIEKVNTVSFKKSNLNLITAKNSLRLKKGLLSFIFFGLTNFGLGTLQRKFNFVPKKSNVIMTSGYEKLSDVFSFDISKWLAAKALKQ